MVKLLMIECLVKLYKSVIKALGNNVDDHIYTYTRKRQYIFLRSQRAENVTLFFLYLNLIFLLFPHFAWWQEMNLVNWEVAKSPWDIPKYFVFKQSVRRFPLPSYFR